MGQLCHGVLDGRVLLVPGVAMTGALYVLAEAWFTEANERNQDPTTREVLRDCAQELLDILERK